MFALGWLRWFRLLLLAVEGCTMALSQQQLEEIHHAARLAVLGMACRGVAVYAFDDDQNIDAIVITMRRSDDGPQNVDVEFQSAKSGFAIGGVSL